MDPLQVIETALKSKEDRLLAIDAERPGLVTEIEELKLTRKVMTRLMPPPQGAMVFTQPPDLPPETPAPVPLPAEPSTPTQVLDAAVEILRSGKSVYLADLMGLLTNKGIRVGGQDPLQNLSTILSRNKDAYGLEVSRRDGWSLKQPSSTPPSLSSELASRLQAARQSLGGAAQHNE